MAALLELSTLSREFSAGESAVMALNEVSLVIEAGEMVAIMGPSGSGKSTLMNILGCLDRPTHGSYRVAGQETGAMSPDELARLRREHFGFIFQNYHLLGDLSALGNVEIPAIYAGASGAQRHARAEALLSRLGLSDRLTHRPGELSGGQRQRVSIARALMNGGDVILADEPTGALDQASGREVMKILQELHAGGHTIILVTHDAQVAAHAQRVIEISDGKIVADRRKPDTPALAQRSQDGRAVSSSAWSGAWGRVADATHMALRAMVNHRMRTLLTMLGIIIGIASVVSVVGLGKGAQQSLLDSIGSLGTNTVDVYPGEGFGDRGWWNKRNLHTGDVDALKQLGYVDSATGSVGVSVGVRYRSIDVSASVNGVGDQYFRVHGVKFAAGQSFDAEALKQRAQDVVIDDNAFKTLFPNVSSGDSGDGGDGNRSEALGQTILLGSVPVRIVGVLAKKGGLFSDGGQANVWLPYTTVMTRFTGQDYLGSLTVRVKDDVSMAAASEGITKLLTQRHGKKDFFLHNNDDFKKTVEQTTNVMTLTVSAIALISLIVGGIGVMNIMLVSVSERTGEIGVRMAVGARQGDILRQFLIEAVLVCLIGGSLGVSIAVGAAFTFNTFFTDIQMAISISAIVTALTVSSLIGVVFGFLPARNAARLDPVDALSRP